MVCGLNAMDKTAMPEKPLTLVLGAWGNIVLGKGILSIWFFILRSLSLNFAVAKHQLFN